jgi:hypothetical protein
MSASVGSEVKVEELAAVPKRRNAIVLDEDEWTERIEAIIERDYFPDIPKLQNKLEWLQVSFVLVVFGNVRMYVLYSQPGYIRIVAG